MTIFHWLYVKLLLSLPVVLITLLGATMGEAASSSYYLNQSNHLPDGTNYLQVTISENGDNIDFIIDVIESAFSVSGNNFGMDKFFFNIDTNLSVSPSNISFTNPIWSISEDKNAGGDFGKFEFELAGPGQRITSLSFSIINLIGDNLATYALGSTLNPSSGEFFAAHIGGFDETDGATSAQFGGSLPVPIPATVWLFGAGLLGLIGLSKRQQTAWFIWPCR